VKTILRVIALASTLVAATVAFAGWRWVTPVRKPDREYPDGLGVEQVRFRSADGTVLFGAYLAGDSGRPGVVLCHGYWRDHFEPLDIGVVLNRDGYHVLLFDFRGCGQSDGNHTTVGYRETEDVSAAIDHLRDRVGDAPLGVLGISMGAAAAIMAAPRAGLKAMVADSPFAHLEGVMSRKVRDFTPHPWLIPLSWISIMLGETLSGGNYRAVRPVDSVRSLESTPMMVIYGERDEFISSDQIDELVQAAPGPKELWILDCGHAMARIEAEEEYRARVHRFFDRHLNTED
jgi:pimeloyl-ACP methyl ester carboxylesterase